MVNSTPNAFTVFLSSGPIYSDVLCKTFVCLFSDDWSKGMDNYSGLFDISLKIANCFNTWNLFIFLRHDWFKVGKLKHMVGMSRDDVRNLEGTLVISVFILDTLAPFPTFNCVFFRFFYWICLFQHFIIWTPWQIRSRQDELKWRVDIVWVFYWFLIMTLRWGAWSIWPSLLCMNSRHQCLFFCPAWQMCSFFLPVLRILDPPAAMHPLVTAL